jgi:hypothetical protein
MFHVKQFENRATKFGFFSYPIFHYGATWGIAEYWGVDPANYPRESAPLTMGGTLILSQPRLLLGVGGGTPSQCSL